MADSGTAVVNRSIGLEHTPTADLLALYAATLHELRTRGIARSSNGPVGDYAEHLFARAFGWTLQPNSTTGFDARDPATALRYEIKARRLSASGTVAQLSALRRLPEQRFDVRAVLLFTPDFRIQHAALVPHAVVVEHATYTAHTNSWRLIVTPAVLARSEVKDVTPAIATAAALDHVIRT